KRLGLGYIREEDGLLKFGSTITLSEIHDHELVNSDEYRIFAETVEELNIVEVKNMATIGGEVCIAGEVDMPTTLLAYDANIVIGSEQGVRSVSMADFHIGYLNNDLKAGEMVIEVQVPRPSPNTRGGFSKFERTAADLPIVNVCVRVALDEDGICTDARVAVGAATLAGVPRRSDAAEKVLVGNKLDEELIGKAAEATADIECINDFRTPANVRSLWVKCGTEDALKTVLAKY
ncbi:MAG: FAD binding domain-containing protein, partial [Proteobacteria bacterium]|nr:FAD binding domain-containing protein [Pseudomonadota bacterium]